MVGGGGSRTMGWYLVGPKRRKKVRGTKAKEDGKTEYEQQDCRVEAGQQFGVGRQFGVGGDGGDGGERNQDV